MELVAKGCACTSLTLGGQLLAELNTPDSFDLSYHTPQRKWPKGRFMGKQSRAAMKVIAGNRKALLLW
ncbi:MAG TPA: hypothetical protein VJU54_10620 [Nitrospiraceae bacterium]|nr:hypothetical protein [Nitrospiraceae bacterium]